MMNQIRYEKIKPLTANADMVQTTFLGNAQTPKPAAKKQEAMMKTI